MSPAFNVDRSIPMVNSVTRAMFMLQRMRQGATGRASALFDHTRPRCLHAKTERAAKPPDAAPPQSQVDSRKHADKIFDDRTRPFTHDRTRWCVRSSLALRTNPSAITSAYVTYDRTYPACPVLPLCQRPVLGPRALFTVSN